MNKDLHMTGHQVGRGRPRGEPTTVIRLPLPVATIARRLAEGSLRAGDINAFLDVEPSTAAAVPFAGASASCGFPSPADDYLDRPLDFNELLIRNPAATFAVRIAGDSMTGAGLFPGDIAIIDRSLTPAHGSVVLALIDGEFTVKRYCLAGSTVTLKAENPAFRDLVIAEGSSLEVWGVVKNSIRMF